MIDRKDNGDEIIFARVVYKLFSTLVRRAFSFLLEKETVIGSIVLLKV